MRLFKIQANHTASFQALPMCEQTAKRRKAGQGLGTRLPVTCKAHIYGWIIPTRQLLLVPVPKLLAQQMIELGQVGRHLTDHRFMEAPSFPTRLVIKTQQAFHKVNFFHVPSSYPQFLCSYKSDSCPAHTKAIQAQDINPHETNSHEINCNKSFYCNMTGTKSKRWSLQIPIVSVISELFKVRIAKKLANVG